MPCSARGPAREGPNRLAAASRHRTSALVSNFFLSSSASWVREDDARKVSGRGGLVGVGGRHGSSTDPPSHRRSSSDVPAPPSAQRCPAEPCTLTCTSSTSDMPHVKPCFWRKPVSRRDREAVSSEVRSAPYSSWGAWEGVVCWAGFERSTHAPGPIPSARPRARRAILMRLPHPASQHRRGHSLHSAIMHQGATPPGIGGARGRSGGGRAFQSSSCPRTPPARGCAG